MLVTKMPNVLLYVGSRPVQEIVSVSEGGEPGTRLGCRHTNAECPLWASPTRKQAVAKPPMVAVQSSVAYVRYQEARQIDAMTVTGALPTWGVAPSRPKAGSIRVSPFETGSKSVHKIQIAYSN